MTSVTNDNDMSMYLSLGAMYACARVSGCYVCVCSGVWVLCMHVLGCLGAMYACARVYGCYVCVCSGVWVLTLRTHTHAHTHTHTRSLCPLTRR